MKVGDLVFDSSLDQRGIIVWSYEWDLSSYGEESEWEHEILYTDGTIDTAYEKELEVISESR